MITQYFRSLKTPHLEEVSDLRPGVWVHVSDPSEEELHQLAHDLDLDLGLLRDGIDPFEVPRFELDAGVAYLYTRYVEERDGETTTAPILIAIGGTFVLTLAATTPRFIEKMVTGSEYVVTTQKTKLFIQLMLGINRRYTRALLTIRREVRRNRRNLHSIKSADVIGFVSLEDTLNDFISALVPTNAALKSLIKGQHLELFEEDVDLIEDLQLSNEQLVESARTLESTIINIRSTYTTILTNNLNQIIKVLTALTIILTIPTIVGSFFGMNVELPLADNPFAFWIILVGTAALSASVAYLFAKREWF
ncbi:hypothetical protein GVX82_00630 [Patescibacteria group bacterium]|nr:hypothetical protein [Patescibacteria group bacterium]